MPAADGFGRRSNCRKPICPTWAFPPTDCTSFKWLTRELHCGLQPFGLLPYQPPRIRQPPLRMRLGVDLTLYKPSTSMQFTTNSHPLLHPTSHSSNDGKRQPSNLGKPVERTRTPLHPWLRLVVGSLRRHGPEYTTGCFRNHQGQFNSMTPPSFPLTSPHRTETPRNPSFPPSGGHCPHYRHHRLLLDGVEPRCDTHSS